jgi:4-diphosphocytidyl-2-C-methyl-D-erythritol kinase
MNSPPAWPAPAKINLFLHITGRRPDGYHELQTLFRLLDWGDDVHIVPEPGGAIQRVRDIPGIPEDQDLSIRAAQLLKAETGCHQGASIGLTKRIPVGAGLGGGSSDAATVLTALNHLWECALTVEELAALGLELGADVPVFIHGHSAWAEGIGERLRPHHMDEAWYVLVFPGIPISTREIFSDPGLNRDTARISPPDYHPERVRNDCQSVVLDRFPKMQELFEDLSRHGRPRLTGTGSCVFLPFAEKNHALSVTNALKSRYNVRAVRGVNRSPLVARLSGVG